MIKKYKNITAALLLLILSLFIAAACSEKKDGKLSFEELMKNGMIMSAGTDRMAYTGLDNLIRKCIERDKAFSIVAGRVKSVRYYREWTSSFDNATVCDVVINDVWEGHDTANVKTGDTVRIRFNYGLAFCKDGIADEASEMDYLSKRLDRIVKSTLDLQDVDPFAFELMPEEDVEYIMCAGVSNVVPMEDGKEYVFFLSKPEENDLYDTVRGALITCPMDETLEELSAKYGLHYDRDYIEIAEEMAALFKGGQNE